MLLSILLLFVSCDMRGDMWGLYKTETDSSGNGKSIEFAYSKVFYTLDILQAEADEDNEESEAVIEGWYDKEGDSVVCTFSLTEDENTEVHVYTFTLDGDTLTLAGYTVDGEEMPFEAEEYKK